MCVSLATQPYEVSLVVADGKGDELIDGVSIIDVGSKAGSRVKRIINTVSNVFEKAKELDADLYHLHDPELMLIAIKLKRMGKKVIFDAHEDLPLQVFSKPYFNKFLAKVVSKSVSVYENYVCNLLDAVVTATPFIKNKFLKVNDNSTDINNFPKLNEFPKPDLSNFTTREGCCYVGNITKVRGIEEIVKSLSLPSMSTKLNLAGKFSEKALEIEVKKLEGWNNVNELGWLDRKGVQLVLSKSFTGLVTLHPIINYQDSLPVKMFEYMASGLPVIYSNIPLWKAIIEAEHCGISVDPYSPKEIADAISYLSKNLTEARAMGERGRMAVEQKYNWGIEEQKLFELYRKLFN
jgi:glycosyltransferase involved in cell wall biosynthesis